jgi:hypothetical protein
MKPNPFVSITADRIQALVIDSAEIELLYRDQPALLRWRDAGFPVPLEYADRVKKALVRTSEDLAAVRPGATRLRWTALLFGLADDSLTKGLQYEILAGGRVQRAEQVLLLQYHLELVVFNVRRLVAMLPRLTPLGEKAIRWLGSDRMRLRQLPARQRSLLYVSVAVCAYSVLSWIATIAVAWYPAATPFFPPGFLLIISTPQGGQALPGILPASLGYSGLVTAVVFLAAELAFVVHGIDLIFKLHRIEVDFNRLWQEEYSKLEDGEERALHLAYRKWPRPSLRMKVESGNDLAAM